MAIITVILSVILGAAVSVLTATIITCKVSEKIFNGAMEYVKNLMEYSEKDRTQ